MIYFYWGADSFRSKQTVDALKKKFIEKYDSGGHNVETIDENDFSLEKFFTSVKSMGFLSPKKCIILKNIFSVKNLSTVTQPVIDYLDSLKNTTEENYLVFWHEGSPRKNSKLFTYLTTRCDPRCTATFEELSNERLRAWIMKQAQELGKSIPLELTDVIIELAGTNTWKLFHEIKKICNATEKPAIDRETIERSISASVGEIIFPLLDAVGSRSNATALSLMEQAIRGKYEPQFIIAMLARHVRLLIETKNMSRTMNNTYALAQSLRVPPFVAKKLMQQSQEYSLNTLMRMHENLVQLDLTSKRDAHAVSPLLTLFVAGI